MSEAGKTLAGRYRLEKTLGEGGMGSVWQARHLALDSLVAVKLLHVGLRERALARFMREARAAASLRSPNVVQIIDFGVDDGVPYMVMELLEGQTLGERLADAGRLSLEETRKVLTDVVRAVSSAHEAGLVHRDLKPDNIFLVRSRDLTIAKVLDFGIVKAAGIDLGDEAPATVTGEVIGTPAYMSPEQLTGDRTLGPATDLWALGVIAFECLCGERPFQGSNLFTLAQRICSPERRRPTEVLAALPAGVDEWFLRATAAKPADRFASASDLLQGLEAVSRGNPLPELRAPEAEEFGTVDTIDSAAHAATERVPLAPQDEAPAGTVTTQGAGVITSDVGPALTPSPATLPGQSNSRRWMIPVGLVAGAMLLLALSGLGSGQADSQVPTEPSTAGRDSTETAAASVSDVSGSPALALVDAPAASASASASAVPSVSPGAPIKAPDVKSLPPTPRVTGGRPPASPPPAKVKPKDGLVW